MQIVFNPTGTQVKNEQLMVRVDLYPDLACKSYAQNYVCVPVVPTKGYPGKVGILGNPLDPIAYQIWLDSLPHVWQLNPMLCHFIQIGETTSLVDVAVYIENILKPADLKTLDGSLVLPNSIHLVSPLMHGKNILSDKKVTTTDFADLIASINQRLSILSLQTSLSDLITPIEPESIDIGAGATDRADTGIPGYTVVGLANPANEAGDVDTVQFWYNSNGAGVKAGIFYLVSASTYRCRSAVSIGNVTAGSAASFTGLTLATQIGDFLAAYWATGNMEKDTTGGSGIRYNGAGGDVCTVDWQGELASLAAWQYSMYGTGGAAGLSIPVAMHHRRFAS